MSLDIATVFAVAMSVYAPADTLQSSNLPPASVKSPKMIGNPISFDDYPPSAMQNHEEGFVSVELLITATGMASSCEVTESARSPALDKVTCKRLMKARFEPARDINGEAFAGIFHTAIGWSMPSPGVVPGSGVSLPVAALPSHYTRPTSTFLTFNATGSLVGCEIKASSGSAAFDETACAVLRKQMKIAAPHASGNGPAAGYRYVQVAAFVASTR